MIPERSEVAKFAKSVFFEELNDVDIYVEDTAFGYQKIFVEIMSRVFDGTHKVSKVFPLGGRDKVADRCLAAQDTLTRPSIFIIDSDLHMLVGDKIPDTPGLYKLPFYCIENILLDACAIHDLLNEEDPIQLKHDLIKNFDFEPWLADICPLLVKLFVEYALSSKLNPTQQTVAYPVSNLISAGNGMLDEQKVNQRIEAIRAFSIAFVGEESYEHAKSQVLKRLEQNSLDNMKFISGKDYVFPLLKIRFRSTIKSKISDLNLKLRLAIKCDISKIKDLRSSVIGPGTVSSNV
jgi:hypothetical protein